MFIAEIDNILYQLPGRGQAVAFDVIQKHRRTKRITFTYKYIRWAYHDLFS